MPRANLTQQIVIEAAAGLADREGFDAVTVSAVARLLRVRPASLYEHVESRDALLDGIQGLAFAEVGALIGDEIAGRSGRDALQGLADACRDYAIRRPGAWAALHRSAIVDTARSPELPRMASFSVAVVRGYAIPASATVYAARLIGSTINGFLTLARINGFDHHSDRENESWSAAIDALDRALNSWPGEEAPDDSPSGSPA